MIDTGAGALAYENAELRQRVAELEREVIKLKRKLEGERRRNDPREKVMRKLSKFTD